MNSGTEQRRNAIKIGDGQKNAAKPKERLQNRNLFGRTKITSKGLNFFFSKMQMMMMFVAFLAAVSAPVALGAGVSLRQTATERLLSDKCKPTDAQYVAADMTVGGPAWTGTVGGYVFTCNLLNNNGGGSNPYEISCSKQQNAPNTYFYFSDSVSDIGLNVQGDSLSTVTYNGKPLITAVGTCP